jgi:hypothetical protein
MSSDFTGVILALLIGGIFGAIGAGLLIFAQRERTKAKAAEKWPVVAGSIVATRVDQQVRTEHSQGRTYQRTSYAPIVQYTYQVNGQAFQGARIALGGSMSYDYNTAQSIANRYQPGQPTTVHYDPANPAEAVLEPKASGSAVLIVVGVIFLLIGIGSCCISAFMLLGQAA